MKKTKKVKKSVAVAKSPKGSTKKDKSKPGKNVRVLLPAVQKKPKEQETMDRKALKTIVAQLKEMGSDIKALKSDTDDLLQKKVNEALQKLPPPDVLKKLETVSPEKLVAVFKQDCLGIFVDLSDVSCVRCKDNTECVKKFLANVRGGMTDLDKAMPDKVEEKAAPKAKLVPVTKYKADRIVFVRDVKNPNPKGDDYHDTLQRVLDGQPETLGELRAIVEQDFDVDTDSEFMTFVTALRDPKEGVIKLDVDLSEKDKNALNEAGYDL